MNFLIPDKEPKMTEAEIMKALECCSKWKSCKECPLYLWEDCTGSLKEFALDLINSKNAKNERLAKEIDRLSQVVLYHDGQVAEARAEAIKEVAERVKDNLEDGWLFGKDAICRRIDQIAKEMGVEL